MTERKRSWWTLFGICKMNSVFFFGSYVLFWKLGVFIQLLLEPASSLSLLLYFHLAHPVMSLSFHAICPSDTLQFRVVKRSLPESMTGLLTSLALWSFASTSKVWRLSGWRFYTVLNFCPYPRYWKDSQATFSVRRYGTHCIEVNYMKTGLWEVCVNIHSVSILFPVCSSWFF